MIELRRSWDLKLFLIQPLIRIRSGDFTMTMTYNFPFRSGIPPVVTLVVAALAPEDPV